MSHSLKIIAKKWTGTQGKIQNQKTLSKQQNNNKHILFEHFLFYLPDT